MILQASRDADAAFWVWAIVLGATLVMVLGFARAGSAVFWNFDNDAGSGAPAAAVPQRRRLMPLAVAGLLIAATAALAMFGGTVTRELRRTAEQTLDTRAYVRAVLGPAAGSPRAAIERR
jgi:multicomponent K+:H+ antiporter subunit D